ncbi:MAG TPA: hypothetical protein VLC79_16720 [Cellvibrio sp.]|nr:hypothetical protein [Cellvibrio sp.]
MPVSRSSSVQSTLSERLQHIVDNRRGAQKAVPIDLSRYLNESQLLALHSLESFGWQLCFVRRPLFMQPVVVVANSEATQYAQLEEDGSVNLKPTLILRH